MPDKRIPRNFLMNCTASQALADIYHEVDRPLTIITGYATLIASTNVPDDKKREMAKEILSNAEYLESLEEAISEYLQIAKEEPPPHAAIRPPD